MNINVLYEDNHLLIVDKPAGTLTQGDATGDDSLVEIGKAYLKEKYHKPGAVYLVPAHRLDRPTSGVLCLARTDKAAGRLAAQFRERENGKISKIYLAAVHGKPAAKNGRLENWFRPGDGSANRSAVLPRELSGCKRACLLYALLSTNGEQSLLAVKLLTGYKHQIRAQLAAAGMPVAGDVKYAPPGGTRPLAAGRAVALHAYSLTLEHPTKKEPLTVTAPLPEYFGNWQIDAEQLRTLFVQ